MKLHEALGVQAPQTSSSDLLGEGMIGLELELEGLPRTPEIRGWRRESDGSLRDGIEYVFDGPQGGSQAEASIHHMASFLRDNPPEPTFRCSTHIHMDVRDLELQEIERVVLAYLMAEGIFFEHCNVYRRYSNFCTPYWRNPAPLNNLGQWLKVNSWTYPQRVRNFRGWPKYTAFNLQPLQSYGSVEFRGSHCITSEPELIALAQRMLHLRRLAKSITAESPLEFVEHLRTMSASDMFPTGLEHTVVDPQVMDTCYANALSIASLSWNDPVQEHLTAETFQGTRGWTIGPLGEEPIQPQPVRDSYSARIASRTADRYNLSFPSGSVPLEDLYSLVVSLRGMIGAAPTMSEFMRDRGFLSYERVSQYLTNRGLIPRNEVIGNLPRRQSIIMDYLDEYV